MKIHFIAMLSVSLIISGFVLAGEDEAAYYSMKIAEIKDGEVVFDTAEDFEEALKVGFFRIKRPENINVAVSRQFAREFTSLPKYTMFGSQNFVHGYVKSDIDQNVRFSLLRDHWDVVGFDTDNTQGEPNYSLEIQNIGHQLKNVGIAVLKSILSKFDIPEEFWFQATGGAACDEGSYTLSFNCYDPKNTDDKPYGFGAHLDWGFVTVLDLLQEGLEVEINGKWLPLKHEDGYLVVNLGRSLQRLLPDANACNHRVILQTKKMRVSTTLFIDSRIGAYRKSTRRDRSEVGMVWNWDPNKRELVNGEPTTDYYEKLVKSYYG